MLEAARASGDVLAEGQALSRLSIARYWLYRFDEARAAGEMALRLAEEAGDRHLLTLTHRNLGYMHLRHGDLVRAHHHLWQAEALARAEGEDGLLAACLQDQSYIAFFRGDYERAERIAREALALAERGRDALTFCGCCLTLGIACGDQGRYREARQAVQAGIERAQASGERHYLPKLLNIMGWLYSEVGDYKTAREWDLQALQACRDETVGREGEAECYTLINLATDALGEGDLATAERYAREFGPVAERAAYSRYRYLNRYLLLQAELALAYGDADAVLRHARQAARMAESKGALKNLVKSALYEGRAQLALGRLEGGTVSLQRAVALADQIGHGSLRWRARLRLGQAYAAQGQPYTEVCQQALGLVQEIAVNLQDERLREGLLNAPPVQELLAIARRSESESGGRETEIAGPESRPLRPAVASAPSPAGLTPREIQVLRLVAQGATNRGVAKALQISVKTVDAHVSHILNKTGCANRAAAAAFAAQHGLISPRNR
jgi:DNA-binding CsgD family transcriptional regulator